MPTTIVRPLTSSEQHDLIEELMINNELWTSHGRMTSLNDGKTIYINRVTNNLKHIDDKFKKFPKTYNILKTISNDRVISRCYWHRLLANDTISKHTDSMLPFVYKNLLDNRYQIYLNCPNNLCVIDGVNCDVKKFEYNIIDFDLKLPHSYCNQGHNPWYFLVFDVLKPGIELIQN